MIGKRLSPILTEIEMTILEHEVHRATKPEYTIDAFRAATKIFMSCMLDKIWELQNKDKMEQSDRENMATKCGEDVRHLIKVYTGIDSWELYK